MCEYFRRLYACMFVGIFVLYNFAQITKFNISKYIYVCIEYVYICLYSVYIIVGRCV